MRRTDREITDRAEMRAILEEADACHLAMADENGPYLVTMNFGIRPGADLVLYFHSAHEGRKIDMLKKNNKVCFAADIDHELVLSQTATSCGCSMRYRSVVGTGTVTFVTDDAEKREALDAIMAHYVPEGARSYAEDMLERTTVLRLDVAEITGKRRP